MTPAQTEASCSPFADRAERFVNSLDRAFARMARSADDRARVWLAGFTALYFACTIARSLAKPLWFDELFTFYISGIPAWNERLAQGGVIPPAFYALTNWSIRLFGASALAVRLPEIFGFWLMCVCLFSLVRRRCAAIYAVLALLFAVGSSAYNYAFEARPYGLILGLAAVSLLCWQSAAEGRQRKLALVILGVSLSIAVNVHYFAAQVVVPVVAGEVWRTLVRRKVDWGVALAVALGLSPLSILLPLALKASAAAKRAPASWRPACPASFVSFYTYLFRPMVFPAFAGIAATTLVYLMPPPEHGPGEIPAPMIPPHELVAATGYLLVPAVVSFLCWLKVGIWYERYGVTAIIGWAVLSAYGFAVFSRERFVMPCLLIMCLSAMWVAVSLRSGMQGSAQASGLPIASPAYPRRDAKPIVVADKVWFLEAAHYSSPDVASRLVYLADTTDDTLGRDFYRDDGDIFLVRHVLPGAVEDYRVFTSRNSEFWLLYRNQTGIEWLPSQLRKDGWQLEYEAQDYDRVLFRVRR